MYLECVPSKKGHCFSGGLPCPGSALTECLEVDDALPPALHAAAGRIFHNP